MGANVKRKRETVGDKTPKAAEPSIGTVLDDVDDFLACYRRGGKSAAAKPSAELAERMRSINRQLDALQERKLASNELAQRNMSLWRKVLSYWDIILLVLLNMFFVGCLFVFLSASYYSPEPISSRPEKWSIGQSAIKSIEKNFDAFSKWAIAKWMHLNGFDDISKEECALMLPDYLNSVVRPIDQCQMCVGLERIERLENITKEAFIDKYAYTAVPVIIRNAISDWRAMQLLNFKFLKELYLHPDKVKRRLSSSKNSSPSQQSQSHPQRPAILKTFDSISRAKRKPSYDKDTCQFFPYKTKFKSLEEVFRTIEENDPASNATWYVGWSNCNDFASSVLRDLYDRPYFLPDESEMSKIDWIFMGSSGNGANIHIDNVLNPSWQAQITGSKRWIFKPPAECMLSCKTLHTVVNPGEILIFDSNRWFHGTDVMPGTGISLTIGSEYD